MGDQEKQPQADEGEEKMIVKRSHLENILSGVDLACQGLEHAATLCEDMHTAFQDGTSLVWGVSLCRRCSAYVGEQCCVVVAAVHRLCFVWSAVLRLWFRAVRLCWDGGAPLFVCVHC